jgi:hypothetical protein
MQWNLSNISSNLAALLLITCITPAQNPPRTPKDVAVESNRKELDNLLLRKPILTTENDAARQAALKQINEDFKALQILNNGVMTEGTSKDGVDYNSLARLLAEIGSKASRLKSNLALPKGEGKSRTKEIVASSPPAFKDELVKFDEVVVRFRANPIFLQPNVVEVELARQAAADLQLIIEKSKTLKKAAVALAKSGG